MPLLLRHGWPSLSRVAAQGAQVTAAAPEDARLLHIGLLNMMPDRALAATERQFLHLLDSHDRRCCAVHLFGIDGIPRSDEGRQYLRQHYQDCAAIERTALDALIITGANVTRPDLESEPFWQDLAHTLQHAERRQLPVVCSCLAAHASARIFHGIERRHLPRKRWGIFTHAVRAPEHPLTAGLPPRFEMPHSRFNDIPEDALRDHGVEVLITAAEAGVQMAAEANGRRIYFQGHPEYEAVSLLKEYKREVMRFLAGEREDYPPLPDRTFSERTAGLADGFRQAVLSQARREDLMEAFPEAALAEDMRQPWQDAARQLYRNWLEGLEPGNPPAACAATAAAPKR